MGKATELVVQIYANNKQFDKSLKESRKQIQDFTKKVEGIGKGFDTFTSNAGLGLSKLQLGWIGVAAAAGTVVKQSVELAKGFEQSTANLKALTGASDEMMKTLKEASIELSGSSGQSAQGVMDAFGMIGSKAPELLSSASALKEVTKWTITLSEATGNDLADSADAVTGILNQFGLKATEVSEIVNTLAAAEQKGAGNAKYLSDAIVKCGSVAGSFKLNYHEVVAVLEQLAQSGIDASSAGTNLRNILTTLETQADRDLKPSVNGLIGTLENLRRKNLDTAQAAKMFGKENLAAYITLSQSVDAAKELTSAITGTNTALEQQEIRNNTLAGSLTSLNSKWESFLLHLNDSNGALKKCVDFLSDIVGWMDKMVSHPAVNGRALLKNLQGGASGAKSESDVTNELFEGAGSEEELKDLAGERLGDLMKNYAKAELSISKLEKESEQLSALNINAKSQTNDKIESLRAYQKEVQQEMDDLDSKEAKAAANLAAKKLREESQKNAKALEDQLKEEEELSKRLIEERKKLQESIKKSEAEFTESLEGGLRDILTPSRPEPVQNYADKIISDYNKMVKDVNDRLNKGAKNIKINLPVDSNVWDANNGDNWVKMFQSMAPVINCTNELAEGLYGLSYAFDAMAESEDEATRKLGARLSFFTQAAAQVGQLIAQIANMVIVDSVTGAAKLPFPANIAAIASTIATVSSIVASGMKTFATGGIVQGTGSGWSDSVPVRVSNGEMILNKRQQGNLFNILDGGAVGRSISSGNVEFKISGQALSGVLRNHNIKTSKIL